LHFEFYRHILLKLAVVQQLMLAQSQKQLCDWLTWVNRNFCFGSEESDPVGRRREGVVAFSLVVNWLEHETNHSSLCGVRLQMWCTYFVIVIGSRDWFISFSLIMSHLCGSFWKVLICFTIKMNVHNKTIVSACPLMFIWYVDCLHCSILSIISFPFPNF
jgi:hypothetical protein